MADRSITFDIYAKDKASGAFKSAGSSAGGFGSKIGGLVTAAAGLAVFGTAAALVKGFVSEARESEKVSRLTEQVIKTTGGAAGVTAGQVGDLATAISNKTGIDDEAIQSGENLLLTFTNVRNEVGKGNSVFDRATSLVTDMSVALGQDAKAGAIQLGKALNDPVKGVTALSKVGVSFTKQQKEQIKTLVESGDTLGAQKIILNELGKEFGGAAEAAADPMQKLGVIVGNLKERVGLALLPIIEKAATWLGTVLPKALDFAGTAVGGFQQIIGIIFRGDFTHGPFSEDSPFVGSLFDLRDKYLPIITTAWGGIRDAIGSVVGFVSGILDRFRGDHDNAATGVGQATTKIGTLLSALRDTFASLFGAIQAIVQTTVTILTDLWDRFGNTLVDKLGVALRAVMDGLTGAVQVLTGIFDLIKAILTGKWGEAWDAIKEILGGAWEFIGGVLRLGLAAISTAFEGAKALVSAAWSAIWDGIKTFVSDAFDGIIGLVTAMPGRISAAASGMWDGITSAFKSAVNSIIRGWNRLEFKIPGFNVGPVHFGGFALGLPDIPYLAKGTRNFGGGLAVVGERGPELVNLPRGADVFSNRESGRMAASAGDAFYVSGPITVVANDPLSFVRGLRQAARAS